MHNSESRNGAYQAELGRSFAIEYPLLSKPAEKLANKISADTITVFGAAAGITGSYFLGFPDKAIQTIDKLSGGRIQLTRKQIRIAGAILLGTSYVCDLLDGAVARKSKEGETRHGKVIDGIVNKMIDISPAIFALSKAHALDDKATWITYEALAPVSTMIRSRGLSHDIPISKTGIAARIGRLPFLVGSLVSENNRNTLGKIMNAQFVLDCIHRYMQIAKSGNQKAIDETHTDLIQYVILFAASRALNLSPLPQELTTVGLELAKLAQVKIKEAYR